MFVKEKRIVDLIGNSAYHRTLFSTRELAITRQQHHSSSNLLRSLDPCNHGMSRNES